MKNFRFTSWVGWVFIFLFLLNISFVVAGLVTDRSFMAAAIALSCFQLFLHQQFRRKSNTLKNHPFRTRFKQVISLIYSDSFINSLKQDTLLNSKQVELINKRSKNIPTEIVNTNLLDPENEGFEFVQTLTEFSNLKKAGLRVDIGTPQCSQPYSLSILNWGMIKQRNAPKSLVHALSQGANMQGCAVNTGRDGLTPQLIRGGGDLVWQLHYDDGDLRNENRCFNEKLIGTIATKPYVKMIEVEFPLENIPESKKGLTAFSIFSFVTMLRALSGGKPIGINLHNTSQATLNFLTDSMFTTGTCFDFITVDCINAGSLLHQQQFFENLFIARKKMDEYELPTKIIAAGPVITEYDILKTMALGAHACFCTGNALFSGDAGWFSRILKKTESVKVANFHRNTVNATRQLMEMCWYDTFDEVCLDDFYRRTNLLEFKTLKDIGYEKQVLPYSMIHVNLN